MHALQQQRARSVASSQLPGPRLIVPRSQPCSLSPPTPSQCSTVCSNWKAFGPTSEFQDGDAEYFRVTNRLSQQHEWFAPRPDTVDDEAMEAGSSSGSGLLTDPRQRPEFGLSMKQISALGLSGAQSRLPDPVSRSGRKMTTCSQRFISRLMRLCRSRCHPEIILGGRNSAPISLDTTRSAWQEQHGHRVSMGKGLSLPAWCMYQRATLVIHAHTCNRQWD